MLTRVHAAALALCALAAAFAPGCSRSNGLPDDPRRLLTEYVSFSFAVKDTSDRERMLAFLTGEAHTRLASWSEDQFRDAFVDSKREFVKLSYIDVKKVSAMGASVTYDLTYLDKNHGHDAKVTVRKLADMQFEQGKWLISEVRNIKELVEYRNEMSF